MPTHIRAQVAWQLDSMLPRDAVQVTPCFRHQLGLIEGAPEWQDLADDLADAINGWHVNPTIHQLQVKLYDIEGEPINRPKAIAVRNPGSATGTGWPREVALCLSFNGGNNEPRNRGRIYLPYAKLGTGTPDVRPSTTIRDKAAALVPIFANLGGSNVDWIVWSPTALAATKVERWYVDDEYDTIRKRGLKPTTRTSGTTGG